MVNSVKVCGGAQGTEVVYVHARLTKTPKSLCKGFRETPCCCDLVANSSAKGAGLCCVTACVIAGLGLHVSNALGLECALAAANMATAVKSVPAKIAVSDDNSGSW